MVDLAVVEDGSATEIDTGGIETSGGVVISTADVFAVSFAAGLGLLVYAARPRRLSPARAVLELTQGPQVRQTTSMRALTDRLVNVGWVNTRFGVLNTDLAIMELTQTDFLLRLMRTAGALTAACLVLFSRLILPSFLPPLLAVLVAATVVAVGVFSETRSLRKAAVERRRELVSVALGLTTITMVGVTTARPMNEVAEGALMRGQGWAFDMMQAAYRRGAAENHKIGESLTKLADRIDSPALKMYAASVKSGDNAAVAVDSLRQRSVALQTEAAQRVMAVAADRNERLTVPITIFGITVMLITICFPLFMSF